MAKDELKKFREKAMEKLFFIGAHIIEVMDEICDEMAEIAMAGADGIFEVCGDFVVLYDKMADLVYWLVGKTVVIVGRRIHNTRMRLHKYRRQFIQYILACVILATGIVVMFSSITDYEYAYNGRTLGIVKDQQDVLSILDMISEQLTQEYGSSITINPETDITFTPVISYGKEIDDADTVLKRFTYMGDIQVTAYGIYADGTRLAIVESEKVANEVLDEILTYYVDNDTDYEYVGFAEEITIEAFDTTLARVISKSAAISKIKDGGTAEVTCEVEEGDTLTSICENLGLTLDELLEMNPELDEDSTLQIGDTYVITEEVTLLTVETVEVTTYAAVIEYETIKQETDSYYVGETVTSQSGKNGKAKVTAKLTKQNGKTVETEILDEEIIQAATDEIILVGTKEKPSTAATGNFIRPVNVSISSSFGWRWGRQHTGIDLATSVGVGIMAADGGTVTLSGWYYGYGYAVIIDHGNGYKTLYGHCSALYVSVGDAVYQGQIIAAVGNTGNSTGPHCHFEIIYNGTYLDPANYV